MLPTLLILSALLVTLLAKHTRKGSRRRPFNLRRVRVQANFGVGALAAADVVVGVITAATTGTLRVMSIKASWSIVNLADAVDGGFEFGVAHSDYTAAEIEECIESQASMDIGDKVANEQSNRLVRTIGVISNTGGAVAASELIFNDGRPVKTKLNWLLSIGDTLNMWVRNSSGTIYTTGSSLSVIGEIWVKDSV